MHIDIKFTDMLIVYLFIYLLYFDNTG